MTDETGSRAKPEQWQGIIKYYNAEKGYGHITRKGQDDIFYHYTDINDFDKVTPVKGEQVTFLVGVDDKGKSKAINIKRAWVPGIVIKYFDREGYGFISTKISIDNVHFRFDCLSDNSYIPRKGDHIALTFTQSDKGLIALNVTMTESLVGIVTAWINRTGEGKILPECSDSEVAVLREDVFINVMKNKDSPGNLAYGQSVSFLLTPDLPERRAILVKNEFPLRRFASLGDEKKMLHDIAEKALEEDWNYPETPDKTSYPILWNYLFYTFEHLEEEDNNLPDDNKKIKVVKTPDMQDIAVFNTGLVSKQYQPLYAIFEKKSVLKLGQPLWNLIGFGTTTEREYKKYLTRVKNLPERAQYFTPENMGELYFNYNLRLDAITDHIIGDRKDRLPKQILDAIPKDMTDINEIIAFLRQYLTAAIDRAIERIKWNYKTAIPQYYPKTKKIQLLLPLCIEDPRKVDVALAVQREHEAYVGYTILELDWAYRNARLISRPDSDWLSPEKVAEELQLPVEYDELERG